MKNLRVALITLVLLAMCLPVAGVSAEEAPVEKIVYAMLADPATMTDVNAVLEKMNAITRESIGVELELIFGYPKEPLQTTMQLMISGGEDLDLMMTDDNQYVDQISQNMLMPLGELYEQYGQGILEAYSDGLSFWLDNLYVNGEIYAIPIMKDPSYIRCFAMRADILAETGYTVDDIQEFADLEKVLAKVHELYPNMNCLVPYASLTCAMPACTAAYYNDLGDSFGVLVDETYNVVNLWTYEPFVEQLRLLNRWYQAGYILPDAATNTTPGEAWVREGNTFAYGKGVETFDYETAKNIFTKNCGYEMEVAYIQDPLLTSYDGTITIPDEVRQRTLHQPRADDAVLLRHRRHQLCAGRDRTPRLSGGSGRFQQHLDRAEGHGRQPAPDPAVELPVRDLARRRHGVLENRQCQPGDGIPL